MPDAYPVDPALEFLARFHVTVGPAQDFGHTPWGGRRVIDITGGHFDGPNLRGQIIPGGADWQLIRSDGSTTIDTRYSLRTDDGANIHIRTSGYRAGDPAVLDALLTGADVDPHDYYFRITATFETSAPAYAWLNNVVGIGSGARTADTVVYDAYVVR